MALRHRASPSGSLRLAISLRSVHLSPVFGGWLMSERRRLRRPHVEDIGLQIAPMVDVTLLLLFFFMLTGKLTKGEKLLKIDLPQAESSVVPQDMQGRVIVNIDDKGNLFTGDQPTTIPKLKVYLKQRFINYPPLKLYIRADERTEAKLVKQVIGAGSEAGAIEVVFGVIK